MAFMLMAVFVFFILCGLFYLVFESASIKKQANVEAQNNAVELANMLSSSAEFTCGSYCIDEDRVMFLNRAAYKSLWGVSSIKIETVYPVSTERECTIANYPNCTLIKIYDNGVGQSSAASFVSLCRRTNENGYVYYKCELARFIVGYEVK